MADLRPGQVLREFKTKSGFPATLRILQERDASELRDYMNRLSEEDTFVALSGEKVSLEEEEKFVNSLLKKFAAGDCLPIVCEINKKPVSIARINRKQNMRKRSRHIGTIVISVRKEYRGEGIGKECMKELISRAKNIKGINILKLTAFAENKPAIRLYEKCGFEVVGRLPRQYLYKGKYQDNIIMQRGI